MCMDAVGVGNTWWLVVAYLGFCQINWRARELRILFWWNRKKNEAWRRLQKKKNWSLGISSQNYCTELRGLEVVFIQDAGLSEVVILKAALPMSLSHLAWTVHISPSISLTYRFFSISSAPTVAWALVTLVTCRILLTHFHAFRLSVFTSFFLTQFFPHWYLIDLKTVSPSHSIPTQDLHSVSEACLKKTLTWHSRLPIILSYFMYWIIFW